jgi:dihydroorotate dehydrogenase
MSLLPYALARPFLFGLDPETAHELTLHTLARVQGTPLAWAYCNRRVEDPVVLAGLKFPNRVGLAAGLDKNARCIDGLGAMGFGFVEVGTVTPLAQPGNPKPRLFRLPEARALINRLGFNNDGLDAFVANVKRSAFRSRGRRHAHAAGPEHRQERGHPDRGRHQRLPQGAGWGLSPCRLCRGEHLQPQHQEPARAAERRSARQPSRGHRGAPRDSGRPAWQARSDLCEDCARPGRAQVEVIAATLQRHGMDGVIATNTTLARDAVKGLSHAEETGGLSGAPVLQASNRVIRQLRAALGKKYPIIGVGGIMSAEDALSKIKAGANVVQIYTGLIYSGPDLVRDAALAIKNSA